MSLPQQIGDTFVAMVESGLIRYRGYPLASIAVADDTNWDEIVVAGAGPLVDFWLCGFSFAIATGFAAETQQFVDLGWGGVAGANPAGNIILTNWPISLTANGAAIGPCVLPTQLLAYPVRIPAGQRIAGRIASSPTGGVAFTELRVILATVVDGK